MERLLSVERRLHAVSTFVLCTDVQYAAVAMLFLLLLLLLLFVVVVVFSFSLWDGGGAILNTKTKTTKWNLILFLRQCTGHLL